MDNLLLVTGTYRSGTTLLMQLLNKHSEIAIEYQPLFQFLLKCKEEFYQKIDHPEHSNFINHYFAESLYSLNELEKFLDQKDFYKQVINQLGLAKNKPIKYPGLKEIIAEEFIPTFINNGSKVILIIRDIRDIICSASYGKGKDHLGEIRPTLFNIHNWRKSIAFANHYNDHPNVHILKYEDLVLDPVYNLGNISKFLNLPSIYTDETLRNIPLDDNSSFTPKNHIDINSIDNYKDHLPNQLITDITSLCYAELSALNYETNIDVNQIASNIKNFSDPVNATWTKYNGDYNHQYLEAEITRYNLLHTAEEIHKDRIIEFFLFQDNFWKLCINLKA